MLLGGRERAVCLRNAIPMEWIERMRAAVDDDMASPGPMVRINTPQGAPGLFFVDFQLWQRHPAARAFVYESPAREIVARLMGSQEVVYYHDHLLVKEGGTTTPTPWHQDQPYYNIDGRQNVSFWIPVDAVSRASTLEFLAGSHRGPWLMPRTFQTQQARWFPEGSLADIPDMSAPEQRERVIGWALEPGDCVAFHMLTLYAAAGVEPGRRRRVFSARYLGDDITHAPRRWRTSPEFDGLAQQLPAGAPMAHAQFPLVWPN